MGECRSIPAVAVGVAEIVHTCGQKEGNMSTSQLDEYAAVKAALPKGAEHFALVYMKGRSPIWGAYYPTDRAEATAMASMLREMAQHCDQWSAKVAQ